MEEQQNGFGGPPADSAPLCFGEGPVSSFSLPLSYAEWAGDPKPPALCSHTKALGMVNFSFS